MKQGIKKVFAMGLAVGVASFAFTTTATAHVVVRPAEVPTASYQTFTVSVPNEKDIPTTKVELRLPSDIAAITPTQKAGWRVDVEKDGTGDDAMMVAVTWSGGTIGVGMRDEFTFSAKTPDSATELRWNAYQTYRDGSVVSWDSDAEGGHGEGDSGPFSVTQVVDELAAATALNEAARTGSEAQTAADRALYVAIAAAVVGLVGVFFATRKQQG